MRSVRDQTPAQCGVVILAAGRSSRMGRPKLLLPWGKTTAIGQIISVWRQVGAGQVAAVCAMDHAALLAELDRLQHPCADRIFNPDPDRGMFSSIQCAAAWTGWRPGTTHWAIVLGDQPHLRRSTLSGILEASAARPDQIIQPATQGRPAHPIILPSRIFRQLAHASENTLRQFLDRFEPDICLWPVDDPGLLLDIDRPEDYQKALGLYRDWQAD